MGTSKTIPRYTSCIRKKITHSHTHTHMHTHAHTHTCTFATSGPMLLILIGRRGESQLATCTLWVISNEQCIVQLGMVNVPPLCFQPCEGWNIFSLLNAFPRSCLSFSPYFGEVIMSLIIVWLRSSLFWLSVLFCVFTGQIKKSKPIPLQWLMHFSWRPLMRGGR